MLELKVSLTTRTPFGGAEGIQAMEVGLLKRALAPVPSALPPWPAPPGPPPARDVTTPAVVTRRTRMKFMSTTATTLSETATSPPTYMKRADVPEPSAPPASELPASVVTAPLVALISRMRWLPSATTASPFGMNATP